MSQAIDNVPIGNRNAKVVATPTLQERAGKRGIFRIIEWESPEGFKRSQEIIKQLTHNETEPYDVSDADRLVHQYAKNIWEFNNTGNNGGLYTLLSFGVLNIAPSYSSVLNIAGTTSGTINPFNSGASFLGVGSSLISTTTTTSYTAGSTSVGVVSTTGFGVGDVVLFTNSTSAQTLGSVTATGIISATSGGNTITLVNGLTTNISASTYIIREGNFANNNLGTGSVAYKGVDNTSNGNAVNYPTVGFSGTTATATWQTTYIGADAQFAWNQCMIGAVTSASTQPIGGTSGTDLAVSSPPANYVCLAVSSWFPSPLTKGNAQISQQYQIQMS